MFDLESFEKQRTAERAKQAELAAALAKEMEENASKIAQQIDKAIRRRSACGAEVENIRSEVIIRRGKSSISILQAGDGYRIKQGNDEQHHDEQAAMAKVLDFLDA